MVRNPKNSQRIMLFGICAALGLVIDILEKMHSQINARMFRNILIDEGISSKRASTIIYDLKRYNYITIRGSSVQLTNKAKMKLVDRLASKESADTKYHLVSFDIPESFRINRNRFRRSIKKMGFKQIQKSLWVSNRNVGEYVEIAAREYKVEPYVAYFIAEHSNINYFISRILNSK